MANELTPRKLAQRLMGTLAKDLPRLLYIDNYIHGKHEPPYIPDNADAELKQLTERSILNLMDHAVETAAEGLYVDSVRPGRLVEGDDDLSTADDEEDLPEWEHWELSRLGSRQRALYDSALGYGHAFTVTEKRGGKVQTKCLSPLRTSALYVDAANDETPYAALTVTEWPDLLNDYLGQARMWDSLNEYAVSFKSITDLESVEVGQPARHGATSCPVTRFAASVDLDGRTLGVVEPLIQLQDRINQTIHNLLVVQAGAAYRVKYATNMAPPYKMTRVVRDGVQQLVPEVDENGNPVLDKVKINPASFLHFAGAANGKEVHVGTLEETPLDGYLQAVLDAIRQFTSKGRIPPHFMAGEIANLSADALRALTEARDNRVGGFKQVFGESWKRVFRLAAELNGIAGAVDDYKMELDWRDLSAASINQTSDGLQKMKDLGAPTLGLIEEFPNMTRNKLSRWKRYMAREREQEAKEAQAQARAGASAVATVKPRQQAATSSKPADRVP